MKKTIYFNLNFDDIHPESSLALADCGGDREEGVFKYFFKMWENYAKLKITLFTTPNWISKSKSGFVFRNIKKLFGKSPAVFWKNEPFKLTKHRTWCDWLNSFKNFEVAVHGYNHFAKTRDYVQEFKNLSYDESKNKLQLAEQIFNESRLKYVKGFRPPGWGISDGLFKALKELKYKFISLDGNAAGVEGLGRNKVLRYKGLVNVPQNWDIYSGTIEDAKRIIESGCNFISAKGHISRKYGRDYSANGLCGETFENVMRLLEFLSNNYKLEFVSMVELVNKK